MIGEKIAINANVLVRITLSSAIASKFANSNLSSEQ
jgi:hypothetical protein